MKERIIEAEEYAPGRFREPRQKKRRQSPRKSQGSKERSVDSYWGVIDMAVIDSCVSVVTIGLIVRLGIVIYYILSCRKVTYDVDISLFGLVAKFFWIWFDSMFLKAWIKYIRPNILLSDSKAAVIIPIITKAACWLVSGFIIHQVIAYQRLHLFFTVSKIMVMGGILLVLVTLFHGANRLMHELSSRDVD